MVNPSYTYGLPELSWLLEQAFPDLHITDPAHSVLWLSIVSSLHSQHSIYCLLSVCVVICLLLRLRETRLFIVLFQAPSTVLGTLEVLGEDSGRKQTSQQTAQGSCCSPPAARSWQPALWKASWPKVAACTKKEQKSTNRRALESPKPGSP